MRFAKENVRVLVKSSLRRSGREKTLSIHANTPIANN